jgi:broad specificity phosphatase PhoE
VISPAPSLAHPVWLIRHAATAWTGVRWCGRADPELSTDGQRAAQVLASDLAAELHDRLAGSALLLVSPARRARQTAAFIADAIGAAEIVDPELVEVDVGMAEGLTWTELEAGHPAVAAAIARGVRPDWPGGETRLDVEGRATLVADRIRAAATARDVVIVSHGAILHAVAGRLVDDGRAPEALGPAGVLRIGPG